ncbi:hypothetical protein J2T17_002296 [Paenibacillus mucilaginosus]|uniref:DUF3906 family protein n=1 Tax=Paenibacillus mucilaginosus TaxID=61624 RepID=UPI003D1A3C2F
MFMYKIEVELHEETVFVVLMAEDDAQAFDALEETLVRHYAPSPDVVDASILEKKRAVKGSAYVIEPRIKGEQGMD